MNNSVKEIKKTFTLQQDQADCGVACLRSIVKYHGGDSSLEQLRQLSGTSKRGTTLLGLLQAAEQIGFNAEGLEADHVRNLKDLTDPAIIHVQIENRQHYLVYYPHEPLKHDDSYLTGDPAMGISKMSAGELDKLWLSKALLKLTPTEKIIKKKEKINQKKQWVISLLKEDLHILTTSLFIGIAIALLGLSTAIFSQKLIDNILPKENARSLVFGLILVLVLLLVRSGLNYLRGSFMVKQGQDFNNRIIRSFYSNLLSLPKSFFDTRKTGDLIARMNDTRRIQFALNSIFGSIVIDFLLVAVSIVFVLVYSLAVGTVILLSIPIFGIILYLFNKPIFYAQKEMMGGYALAESNFVDTIQGVSDIKSMNKQSFFERANGQVYETFQRKIAALGEVNIKFGLTSEITGTIFIVSIFGIASWLVLTKELKLGEMVALLGMAANVVPALNRLVIANIQIQEALVAFDRMFEFTSMEKEQTGSSEIINVEEGLKLENVSFRFPGRKQLLKNVSLHFKKGEIVVLLGESGSGKSTILQLIQKFYQVEHGKILLGQIDIQSVDTKLWRDQIGSVPQEIKIFNGNLLFNITLSDNPEAHQQAIDFCEQNGLGRYFTEFPQGYLTLIGEEGVNISGGQKQLVALARALFRNPKFLLLDEATSAMDKNMENFALELLQKEKSKMAILLITHRNRIASSCDHVYSIENGIVFQGQGVPS